MIGEPGAGNPPVRFDEGMQETGGNLPLRHPTLRRRGAASLSHPSNVETGLRKICLPRGIL
jgi:hypothetical protein